MIFFSVRYVREPWVPANRIGVLETFRARRGVVLRFVKSIINKRSLALSQQSGNSRVGLALKMALKLGGKLSQNQCNDSSTSYAYRYQTRHPITALALV